ncbi:AraC family transcriptional regulator [Bradyrhizobium sp. STM 3809]|uniref:helix-turn-helix domain-containing protein n=1 Tax=Bradyrhizobium sp. STM 3809 TaxID=551936 RepID=UPI000240ADB1|nr:AraC family transcriptional regulator [Bradyrhizobium sp. STM 3809]CCD99263.1 putative transcriptional regulator, AraC family [Bradyrhizobium sp. STM 3809]
MRSIRQEAALIDGMWSSHPIAATSFESASGALLRHCRSDDVEEIDGRRFDAMMFCLQLRPTSVTIWHNERQVHAGPVPIGLWQAHAPGDSFRAARGAGFECIRLMLSNDALANNLRQFGCSAAAAQIEFASVGHDSNGSLLALSRELRRALLDGGGSAVEVAYIESLATTLFGHLLVHHSNRAGGALSRPPRSAARIEDRRLRQLIDYCDSRLGESLSVADLAAFLDLSVPHLTELFRRGLGCSPYRWIMQRRIEHARAMLAERDRSITDIAIALGFASSQHFATVFRNACGLTPSEYRKQLSS